jgi:hypothetical protein
MRLINLVARPHPAGNRIDVTWVHPNPAQFPGMRIVRRAGAFPLSPVPASDHEGVVVADTNPIPRRPNLIVVRADGTYTTADTGLKGETVYYYSLFPYAGNPPNYDLDRRNRAAAMATAPYNFAGQMADLLPGLYHRFDTPVTSATGVVGPNQSTGQLRSFLDLPGNQLDLLYSFARALGGLRDVENVDSRLLPLLAQWIGWRIDLRRQRLTWEAQLVGHEGDERRTPAAECSEASLERVERVPHHRVQEHDEVDRAHVLAQPPSSPRRREVRGHDVERGLGDEGIEPVTRVGEGLRIVDVGHQRLAPRTAVHEPNASTSAAVIAAPA